MKINELIIILYRIIERINKNKISKELKIRCNSDYVKHSTIIIQVSKDRNFFLYNLTISCDFYYITLSLPLKIL